MTNWLPTANNDSVIAKAKYLIKVIEKKMSRRNSKETSGKLTTGHSRDRRLSVVSQHGKGR